MYRTGMLGISMVHYLLAAIAPFSLLGLYILFQPVFYRIRMSRRGIHLNLFHLWAMVLWKVPRETLEVVKDRYQVYIKKDISDM